MVSPVHGDHRRCQAEIPLIVLCRFPEPVLISAKVIFCGLARVAMVDIIPPIGWGVKLGGARPDCS
jgi:hypothetical protein